MGIFQVDDITLISLDLDEDGKITVADYIAIRLYLLKMTDIYKK